MLDHGLPLFLARHLEELSAPEKVEDEKTHPLANHDDP